MDNFWIELQAKLDEAKSKGNINSDIDKLQAQVDKLKLQAELDPKTAQNLARDIEKVINQKITISNIDIDTNSAAKSGQDYGKQFSHGVSQGIKNNETALKSFKKSLENIGMGSKEIDIIANKIKNLGVQIETLNQTQSVGKKDVLSVNIAGIDQYGQAIKLTQKYNTATGKLINSINDVSTAQQRAGASVNNFAKQKSQAVNNLTNQINQLNRAASDQNAARPITDSSHLSSLSVAYNDIIVGIERMKNASTDTFVEEQNNVKTLISNYKSLVSEFRNAENIATQMKSSDISSGIAQAQERLGKLKANSSGFEQMTQTIRELDVAIEAVGDKSSLDKFLDDLRVAESQLGRVKAEAKDSLKIENISDALARGDYDKQLRTLENSYSRLGLTSDEIKTKTNDVSVALDNLKKKNLDTIVQDENDFTNALKKSKNEASILKTELDNIYNPKRQFKLSIDIQNWLSKNSRASSEAKRTLTEYYKELSNGRVSVDRLEYINQELKNIDAQQRGLGKLGKNIKDQFSEATKGFTQWMSVSSGVMLLISKTKDAVSEIKELDNILTEISKTSDMTSQELKQLGMDAYDSASKYGRTASDYLLGVQEMNRSGFYGEKGTGMAESSLLAQSAGDMDAELANKYILANNAAYKLGGNVEKLNGILDGQNQISNRNSVAMADMAESMTIAGTVASGYRVKIEDLSAMIGTMEAVTKSGGSEVGNAIKAILINLQNVTSDKIAMTLDRANASMTETVNGAKKLREPIDILRDLAKTFNQLDEDDPLRAEILTNIGGKVYHVMQKCITRMNLIAGNALVPCTTI